MELPRLETSPLQMDTGEFRTLPWTSWSASRSVLHASEAQTFQTGEMATALKDTKGKDMRTLFLSDDAIASLDLL